MFGRKKKKYSDREKNLQGKAAVRNRKKDDVSEYDGLTDEQKKEEDFLFLMDDIDDFDEHH
jgi:hypothetical protein